MSAYVGKDVSLSEKHLEIGLQPETQHSRQHDASQQNVVESDVVDNDAMEESTSLPNSSVVDSVAAIVPPTILHRTAEVRKAQHLSLACLARRLGKDVAQVRELEQPETDMTLSELYRLSIALDVPVSELLIESSDPIRNRGLLLRIMKTARTIFEKAQEKRTVHLAQTLMDQLVDLMPELEDISSWPDIGQSREFKDYGVAVIRRFDSGIVSDMERGDY